MYLYYCEQYGLDKAINCYENDYRKIKSKTLSEKPPSIELYLKGKLNYLSMVKGKDDPTYLKLEQRFTKLFDRNINYVSSILEIWKKEGIDAARERFYLDKQEKNEKIKLNNFSRYLNDIKDPSYNEEKIIITKKTTPYDLQTLWKQILNVNIPLETFKSIHGWQFEKDKEVLLAYKKAIRLGNQSLLDRILLKPNITIFIDNLNDENEKKKAKDFLLNYVDQDYKELEEGLRNKEFITEFLSEKFNLFKKNSK
jgi:hypothetical protein